MESVVTPVNIEALDKLLTDSNYDQKKKDTLLKNFREGYRLGFQGNKKVKRLAPNLKLEVGNEVILWNKVMKEVKLKRFAGPFNEPPFEYFIQSPIGLVPKDNGMDTRLIFHLSYPRQGGESINSETPREACSVKYPEFDDAVRMYLKEIKLAVQAKKDSLIEGDDEKIIIFVGKSDMRSAFRNLGMKVDQFCLLIMKARSPLDGKIYFFVDKCLPFGVSISC